MSIDPQNLNYPQYTLSNNSYPIPSAPPIEDEEITISNLLPSVNQEQTFYPSKEEANGAFHTDNTAPLLEKCEEIACSILKTKQTNSDYHLPNHRPKVQPVSQSFWSVPLINISNHPVNIGSNASQIHHHYSESSRGSHKRKNAEENKLSTDQRILTFVVGTATLLGLGYLLGKNLAQKDQAHRSHLSFDELKSRFEMNKDRYQEKYQNSVRITTHAVKNILDRQKISHSRNIKLIAGGLVTGGAFIAASILSSSLLMIAASVGAVATGSLALFKFGYACFDSRDQEDAEIIQKQLNQVKYIDYNNIFN